MAQPAGRGGARGQKMAEIELEHLTDSLKGLVKSHGAETVFQFKGYFNVTKPMAVNGLALKCHVEFVEALSQVNEKLEFKFSDLKEGFSETLKAFPHVRQHFPLSTRADLNTKLSDTTMTILTHVRRLKDERKFLEACKNLDRAPSLKPGEAQGIGGTRAKKQPLPRSRKRSRTVMKKLGPMRS